MSARLEKLDADDGYLTEEYLSFLREHLPDSPRDAALLLVEELPVITRQISCVSLDVEDDIDDFRGPIKRVLYSTGGWSGAEELIGLILSNFWVRHFHSQWRKGGHFEFEVPMSVLGAR